MPVEDDHPAWKSRNYQSPKFNHPARKWRTQYCSPTLIANYNARAHIRAVVDEISFSRFFVFFLRRRRRSLFGEKAKDIGGSAQGCAHAQKTYYQ